MSLLVPAGAKIFSSCTGDGEKQCGLWPNVSYSLPKWPHPTGVIWGCMTLNTLDMNWWREALPIETGDAIVHTGELPGDRCRLWILMALVDGQPWPAGDLAHSDSPGATGTAAWRPPPPPSCWNAWRPSRDHIRYARRVAWCQSRVDGGQAHPVDQGFTVTERG